MAMKHVASIRTRLDGGPAELGYNMVVMVTCHMTLICVKVSELPKYQCALGNIYWYNTRTRSFNADTIEMTLF